MSLRDVLSELVNGFAGGLGAVVMGLDGIAIDEVVADDCAADVSLMAIEYSSLLREIVRTTEVLQTGGLEEVSFNTDQLKALLYPVSSDFFLIVVLNADGNYGKARFLARRSLAAVREFLL